MIRSLRGIVQSTSPTHLVLDVQGVGYLIYMNTLRGNYTIGDTALLHTHLAVRENALDLYGFSTTLELEFFHLLLSIPKIGPKSALQILSQADTAVLTEAIRTSDAGHLHKVSGIGKKTAENIVQFLHEKIDHLVHPTYLETSNSEPAANRTETDAIDALISLGYNPSEARESVRAITTHTGTTDLITKALRSLSQS